MGKGRKGERRRALKTQSPSKLHIVAYWATTSVCTVCVCIVPGWDCGLLMQCTREEEKMLIYFARQRRQGASPNIRASGGASWVLPKGSLDHKYLFSVQSAAAS